MKGRCHVLHPCLPSGPNRRYVNHKLLEGAHVRRRGPTHEYCTSKVPCTVPLVGSPQPLSLPSLENRPRSLQPPERRVAGRCCPRTTGRGERAGAATWRAPERQQLRFVSTSRGESPAPAVPKLGKANTRARAPANLTAGTATDRNSLILALPSCSLSSTSSFSSSSAAAAASATATPRPPPPPPASAPCLRPVPSSSTANLVSGSRRGAAIGRRKAPRHNGAGRRRRAGQLWGFPLSPPRRAVEKVRAPGRHPRASSGAGRTRRGEQAPGAGVAQVGRSGAPSTRRGGPRWWRRRTG